MKLTSALPHWNCLGQPVFVRADLNVPMHNGTISNDRRLHAILPTLDALIQKRAMIVLATHLGRPTKADPTLSTKQLLPWFVQRGYTISFCATIQEAQRAIPHAQPGTILLLENLRFFPQEQEPSLPFAQELASLANWYVDDAFGALHRNDTSITRLAEQFPPDKRTVGFLVQKEVEILDHLRTNPQHPVCIVLGGNKVSTKLPLIRQLLPIADTILLCPAIVFTFAKALELPVGKSIVEWDVVETARTILQDASTHQCSIQFPVDYQVAQETFHGPLSIAQADQFSPNAVGISIGPETEKRFTQQINAAQTTFFNGAIGFLDRPETLGGMDLILTAMADGSGTSIVTGGDSLAALDQLGITGITHTITGGGSALAYLSGVPLPGLQPFMDQ